MKEKVFVKASILCAQACTCLAASAQGRWWVQDWKNLERCSLGRAWIQPEENLLSALIRGPSLPEGIAPTSGLARSQNGPSQQQHLWLLTKVRQECPLQITEIMADYLHKMQWRTPFLRRLRALNTQWHMAIDSLACAVFDFSTCCQNAVQPRNCPRLGHFRDTCQIYHTWQAYERLQQDDTSMPGARTPDQAWGPLVPRCSTICDCFPRPYSKHRRSGTAWYISTLMGANRLTKVRLTLSSG